MTSLILLTFRGERMTIRKPDRGCPCRNSVMDPMSEMFGKIFVYSRNGFVRILFASIMIFHEFCGADTNILVGGVGLLVILVSEASFLFWEMRLAQKQNYCVVTKPPQAPKSTATTARTMMMMMTAPTRALWMIIATTPFSTLTFTATTAGATSAFSSIPSTRSSTRMSATTADDNSNNSNSENESTNKLTFRCSCFCGNCVFEVRDSTPIFRTRCHCSICQRFSGADSVAFAGFPINDVHMIQGKHVSSSSSETMNRHRCNDCGSPTYNRSLMKDYEFIDFGLSVLQRDATTKKVDAKVRAALQPATHIHYDMRYEDATDDLPKFFGMFEQLVDNAGNPINKQQSQGGDSTVAEASE